MSQPVKRAVSSQLHCWLELKTFHSFKSLHFVNLLVCKYIQRSTVITSVGYQMVHKTSEREFVTDKLEPGHTYRIRVCCSSAGGQSDVCTMGCFTNVFVKKISQISVHSILFCYFWLNENIRPFFLNCIMFTGCSMTPKFDKCLHFVWKCLKCCFFVTYFLVRVTVSFKLTGLIEIFINTCFDYLTYL